MPKGVRLKPEQVVAKLREIEVKLSQGKDVLTACREAGATDKSYYRWRREYGGLKVDQARRLKQLEKENARLKRLVGELHLEKAVLTDVAWGDFFDVLSDVMLKRGVPRPFAVKAGLSSWRRYCATG